jgi:tetratricopeptide (TPR) repeat protein
MSPNTTRIEHLLEDDFRKQLGTKDIQIAFLQGQLERLQNVQEPSPRARELAAQIPSDADPYALALKAIAEKRFDDARQLLKEAQKAKEIELSRIYEASGQTETFAGHYTDALDSYRKALALKPDDPALMNETAIAFFNAGKYAEAEPLLKRSLAIREKGHGPEHPDVARSLNNLAEIYRAQGKYAEAEPLYERSLAILEKALGPEHTDVAQSLNNLAALYDVQGKYAEAEPLFKRSLAIREKALGPEHPDVAVVRENLIRCQTEKNGSK